MKMKPGAMSSEKDAVLLPSLSIECEWTCILNCISVLAFQHPFKYGGFVGFTRMTENKWQKSNRVPLHNAAARVHLLCLLVEHLRFWPWRNIHTREEKGYDLTSHSTFQQDHPALYHAPKHYQLCGSTLQPLFTEYQDLLCFVDLCVDLCNLVALRRVLYITP